MIDVIRGRVTPRPSVEVSLEVGDWLFLAPHPGLYLLQPGSPGLFAAKPLVEQELATSAKEHVEHDVQVGPAVVSQQLQPVTNSNLSR